MPESASESQPPLATQWIPLGLCVGLAWLSLVGTFALPVVPLESQAVSVAALLTYLGGVAGAPIVAVGAAVVYSTRSGAGGARECGALFGSLVLALGALAGVNEFVTKPAIGSPRPYVQELASRDQLGVTPAQFYALGDRQVRRTHMAAALVDVPLPEAVRSHWVQEAGYSFPSGHSLAAMTLATCFAVLGWSARGPRRLVLVLLLPWAVLVGYTRVVLRVHAPLDVVVGGGLGVGAGVFAAWLTGRLAPQSRPLAVA